MSIATVDKYMYKVGNSDLLEDLKKQAMTKLKNEHDALIDGWGKNFGFDFHYPLVSRSLRLLL